MTKLKISGLKESAEAIAPTDNGTYSHIGSKGGTEQMYEGLTQRVDPSLLENFNIICSRVRSVDENKMNILWLHDTWDDPESQHLKDKKSLDRFTKLVFVSNYQQSTFNIGLNVPYDKGIVLQNAIVPFEDHVKEKDGPIRLIYHTTPHRGLELLVPVFEHLADQRNLDIVLDVYSSFEIYGWKQRDEPYLKLFDRCRAHPKINYHGYQPNEVVREALKKAHIYAYPNIWPETSCISVLEAMSAGCTVVCSNMAALPETCANFAAMYNWNEDHNKHANTFAGVLNMAVENFWDEQNQAKLHMQRIFFNNFYNWNLRAAQWDGFLRSLKAQNG